MVSNYGRLRGETVTAATGTTTSTGDYYYDVGATGAPAYYAGSNSFSSPTVDIDDIMAKLEAKLKDQFAKAVIRCQACGQWGARFCACGHCGSPIE